MAVDDVDAARVARQEVVGDEARERDDVGEGRPVAQAVEVGLDRHAGAAHRIAALAADGDERQVAPVVDDLLRGEPHDVRREGPGERPVRRDQDDDSLAALALGEQRMLLATEHGRQVREDLLDLLGVGTRCERRVLRAAQLRRRHELHRPRDLADVADRADAAPDLALQAHRTRHLGEEGLAEFDDRLVERLRQSRR